MTDTEKDALERRIDELCAENERLRKAKDTMRGDVYEIGAMLVKVKDDNAKLRELEGHMLRCMKRNSDCDYCLANGEHCEISYIEADALELEIEVPDGEV